MRLIFVLLLMPFAAHAQESLMGREVSLQVLTMNRDAILFEGPVETATVGQAAEFGLSRERPDGELDVVPVRVDIGAASVSLDYRDLNPDTFFDAEFNGYAVGVVGGCPAIAGAQLDPAGTSMLGMDDDRITWTADTVRINVARLTYNRKSRIAVALDLTPCATQGSGKKSKS